MKERRFEVVVIGGGHAGVEAAWACANVFAEQAGSQRGATESRADGGGAGAVALVTIDPTKIGVMSCNPAIGGLAKGQLVREVDALNGLMGLATDATGIQFKRLNSSKGPAVFGPRAQCDKHAYAEEVQRLIAMRPEIEVVAGTVEKLIVEGGKVRGVVVACAGEVFTLVARAVVLTTGTFMRGLMHTGESKTEGGRHGEAAAVGISGALKELGFELGRLKTGTPPRLKKGSIRWDELKPAPGDALPVPFSELSCEVGESSREGSERSLARSSLSETRGLASAERFPCLTQVDCRQTQTTPEAAAVIRANLHRAPMYSGQIESVGPRYCPSIEDKVVRFAERETHGVFLEPESLRDDWIYCNGISTSLPADVQDAIVRSMPGCERAEIYRYGYAVEYDMVRPHQILATGMTKAVEGLFLAGQINGTSGYEEAAAQGLIAGLNAARYVRGEGEVVFGREEGYLGVMMDDLITKTPVEPYRMFTSRAEYRLLLRGDNAPDRLTGKAEELGLLRGEVGGVRKRAFERRRAYSQAINEAIRRGRDGGMPMARMLRLSQYEMTDLRAWVAANHPELAAAGRGVFETVYADWKYEPYVEKARAEIKRAAELEHRAIPAGVDFGGFVTMRTEARQALARFKPRTFGQASRLEGMTPADLTLLSVLVERGRKG
ncbi:MAG: tRNA uridine-5-carboxymethylaminomethyl(34) synthesis enzyme MnmG [Tepidisphaera sp.]